jgi:hypothetical protein
MRTVRECMSTEVSPVGFDATLIEAAQRMHLPACQRERVVGVLSLADIVFGHPDEERGTISPPPAISR